MADTSNSPAVAKADLHDGRFTHQSAASPGGPGGPTTAPTPYPKWVTPKNGKAVIVNDPAEEKSVMSEKGFSRLGVMLTAFIVSVLLIVVPQAVTVLSTTTLSTALAAPAQGAPADRVVLASVANVTATSYLYVDTELMQVLATPVTGTPVQVKRGVNSMTGAHAAAATVTIGPGNAFKSQDPPAGACVAAAQLYSPWINVQTGNVWVCRTAGVWNGTNIRPLTYASTQNGVQ